MNTIVEHINSLGHSFVEFALPMLIQSGVLIVILLLLDLLLRKKVKAVFRYWIWMLVLLKLILPTSLSSPLSLGYLFGEKLTYQDLAQSSPRLEPTVPAPAEISSGVGSIYIQPNPYIPPTEPVVSVFEPAIAESVGPPQVPVTPLSWQGVVFLVWMAVVIAMGLLLLQRALFVRGLVAQAKKAGHLMNDALSYCCASMGIKSKVGLKISVNATTPSVCGLIRPVILVPWKLTSTLGASRLRTILMHELAHIRRGDLWVNLVQTALQIIYFYNPLLWLANCVIRRIREQAVDEAVIVAMGEKARKYPQTLVDVAKMAFKRPALGLRLIGVVESRSALAGRIKHILGRPMPKSARLGIVSVISILITAAVLLPMARASRGVVLTVDADGSAEYSSIQKAIDAASTGAVVRIAPGVYKEQIKIHKPLTLEGAGWNKTTITAENNTAEVFEEVMGKMREEFAPVAMKKMQDAKTEEERKAIEAEFGSEFEAKFKDKFDMQAVLVSDTEGVVIRGLKISYPGRHIEDRLISVPIVRFSNAEAKMSGCVLTGCPGDGIHVMDGSSLEIRNCLVGGLWSTGIVVGEEGGAGSRLRILDSDVRNCYYAGIRIRAGNKPAEIKRCRVSGAAWHGITYSGNSPTIEDNAVFGNARIGIGASYKAAGIVRRNIIYGNEIGGMSCSYGSRPVVKGNTFANSKESGLRIFNTAKPVVRKNIFVDNPTAVFCGNFGGDEPSIWFDGVVTLENNLFWDCERKAIWQHLATEEQELKVEDISLGKETGNIEVDPLFADLQGKDLSLRANSPALRSGIGVAEPLAFYSPWPLQDEELAIIPDGDTRDSRHWKHQAESTPMAKIEKAVDVQAGPLDHFVGRYALAAHPDTAAFEITKKGDKFIFRDLGGPKFEIGFLLKGLEGRRFEMEKGRDNLKFGNNPRERYSVRYNAAEDRYILDSLGMRGEVQDGFSHPLTDLVKISGEKLEDKIDVPVVSLDHFVGKYALAGHPDTAAFEITKKGDVFIFRDLGGPKFEMEPFLKGIGGQKFEMEKGMGGFIFGEKPHRFLLRYDPWENRYSLDNLYPSRVVQYEFISPLIDLVKVSGEKPEDYVPVWIKESISPTKLFILLVVINSCAAETDLNIESVSIKENIIKIEGDTSGRTNTRKFLDVIEKNGLQILQLRLDAKGNRDKFSMAVEPKKNFRQWWQRDKTDIQGVEENITPKLLMLFEAFSDCTAQTKLSIESVSITARNIEMKGGTSSRTNTQKFLDALKKNELQVLRVSYFTRDNRNKFSITAEPGENWRQWWQPHKADIEAEIPAKEEIAAEEEVASKLSQLERLLAKPPIFAYDVKLNFADPTVRDGTFHSEQSVAFALSFHNIEIPPAGIFTIDHLLIGQTTWPVHLEENGITIKEGVAGQKISYLKWPADEPRFDKVIKIPVKYGNKEYSCPVHVELDRRDKGVPIGSYWFCAYLSGRLPWGAGGCRFEIVNLDQQMEFRLTGDGGDPRDAVLGIDINGDGRIDPAKTGGEQFDLYEPFIIGSKTYQLAEVDPYLPRVVFRELDARLLPDPLAKADIPVEVEGTGEENQVVWGKPSQGVQVGITVEKEKWRIGGDVPRVNVEVRISDPKKFQESGLTEKEIAHDSSAFAVEIDGKQYKQNVFYTTWRVPLRSPFKIVLFLDDEWLGGHSGEEWLTPGRHKIRILFVGLGMRLPSGPVEIEVLPDNRKLEPWPYPWGKAVGGVQVSAHPAQPSWPVGSEPVIRVCMRNQSSLKWWIHEAPSSFALEVDGKRYENNFIFHVWRRPFAPGDVLQFDLKLSKSKSFHDGLRKGNIWPPVGKPPPLLPGKHTVRVLFTELRIEPEPASRPVEFEIVPAGSDVRVKAEPGGATSGLVWGKQVNGLRAAVEFVPRKKSYSPGERVGIRYHIQNVSAEPIQFVSDTWRQNDRATIEDEDGNRQPVSTAWYSDWTTVDRYYLKPGEKAVVESAAFGIAANNEQADDLGYPVGYTLVCVPGIYSVGFSVRIPNARTSSLPPQADDWEGVLHTGKHRLVVTAASGPDQLTAVPVEIEGTAETEIGRLREVGKRRDIAERRKGRIEFFGLDLTDAPRTTKSADLPDLFEERPPGSKSYEMAEGVIAMYGRFDGIVYYIPEKGIFYIRHDKLGSSTRTFYGPFNGDPKQVLDRQIDVPIKAEEAGASSGKRVPASNEDGPRITFESLVCDLGQIPPKTKHVCEFKFTNTGSDVLRITKVSSTCGCITSKLKKKEYAPGESETLEATFQSSTSAERVKKYVFVYSNDKVNPRVILTVKAEVVIKVAHEPKKLNLVLDKKDAGCPAIILTSLDNQPFSITGFKSTGDSITADFDSSVKETSFVLIPKVDMEKLGKGLNGRIDISLNHPECKTLMIVYRTLPEFGFDPRVVYVREAEPRKSVTKTVRVLSNYNENVEIESTSSKKNIIKVLSQEKVPNGYQFELQITPPDQESKRRVFTDVFTVVLKGGPKLQITCYGIYSRKRAETAEESLPKSDVHLEVAQIGGDSVYGSGDIVVVSEGKSKVYGSIQEAIDAAPAGSVVRIGPGVYKERLEIDKPLTLEGAGWDQTTIVTENNTADAFEEAISTFRKRILEAKSEEHAKKLSAELQAQFEAEMKENMAAQTHLVSDTGNVVIRNLKLTSPGRNIDGRALSVPIIKFSNAGALVSGCAVVGTPGNGINIEDGSDVEIRDSLVAGVWSTGIAVAPGRGDVANARIINCDVRNCYHRGITIGPGCDSTVVRGCRISGSSWHGIRYDNASPTIVGNLIFANVRSGIYASGGTAASVNKNLFYGNEINGISCWFKNQDKIEANTFVANKHSALEVLGASRPIVRKNIFYANPTAVFCGDIGDDSTSAASDGTVNLEENLFWGFEYKVAWRHAGDAEDEIVTEEVELDEKTRNVVFNPEFKDITAEDFSLKLDSPARRSGIGAADLLDSESPWPLQDEEIAIIPEDKTEDTSWMGRVSSTGKIARPVVVPVANKGGNKAQESIKGKPGKQEGSEHPGRISGVVINSDTGDPIVGAYVGVGDFGDSGGSNYSRHRSQGFHDKTKTDTEGRFELGGLVFTDKHRYLEYHPLVVTHPDFVRHDEKIKLPSDGPAPDVKVSLVPAAKIEVTIVDADGNPIPGQWLIRLEALDGRRFIPPGSDPHLSSFASNIWAHWPDLRKKMGISQGFTFTELDTGEYSIEALKFQLVDKPTPGNIWNPTINYHGSIPNVRVQAGQAKRVRLAPQDHQTRLTITHPEYPDKLMEKLERSSRMPLMCLISRSPGALLWDDGKIRHLEDQRLGRIDQKRFVRGFFIQGKPLTINNLPPDSYSLFTMAVYGDVAGYLIGARADLAKGDKITVDIPWRQPTGPSMFGPNRSFDYPVNLEAKDYSVSQICKILTEITQSNPRIIADQSIENEKLSFGRGDMSVWDLLEKLYLDRGWRLEEGQEKTLIIKPVEQTDVQSNSGQDESNSPLIVSAVDNKAALTSGATVELLGLTYIPVAEDLWWRTDGSPLPKAPFHDVSFTPSVDPNWQQFAYYTVAMQIKGKLPREIGLLKWDFTDAVYAGTTSAYANEKRVYYDNIHSGAVKFPKAVKRTKLRLGIVSGDWQTLVKGSHYGVYREGEDSIIVRTPERAGGLLGVHPGEKGLHIGVTYNVTDRDFRVVAVDKDGKMHVSARSGSSGTENLRRTTASFPDLTRDKLQEFRFQTRPYEWVEFKDVSLRPSEEAFALAGRRRVAKQKELEKWLGQGKERQIREQILILRESRLDHINEPCMEQTEAISAMRELVRIAEPAVQELTTELRQAEHWLEKSLIAFVLRAIGNEYSVPALIEVLARSKYRGEYGIYVKDDELARFMLDHQHREPDESERKVHSIIIACPVIEITKALEKITEHSEGPDHFSPEAAEVTKDRWKKWWEDNENKRDVLVESGGDKKPQESIKAEPRKQEGSGHPGRISGVVVNSVTGQPIAGAYVGVGEFGDSGGSNYARHREQGLHSKTETDENGRFELDGLVFTDKHSYLEYHPLVVTHPDFVRRDERIELLSSGPVPDVTVKLRPAARINVTVVDEHDKPLKGLWILRLQSLDGRRFIPPGQDRHLSAFASKVWLQWPGVRQEAFLEDFSFKELDAGEYKIEVIQLFIDDAPTEKNPWAASAKYYGAVPYLKLGAGETEEVRIKPVDYQNSVTIKMPEDPFDKLEDLPMIWVTGKLGLILDPAKVYHPEDDRLGRAWKNLLFYGAAAPGDVYTIRNLPPGSYNVFAVYYGKVPTKDAFKTVKPPEDFKSDFIGPAIYMSRAEMEVSRDRKTTVELPPIEIDGAGFVKTWTFGRRARLEARQYSVKELCEILTEKTESNPRIIAEPSIANEMLKFNECEIPIWDVLENIYLDRGWKVDEAAEETLIIRPG